MTSPAERLIAKLEQLPIGDDAPMCSLLRTTLLTHAQHGSDITEPTVLGLLAITGVLEERLTRLGTVTLIESFSGAVDLSAGGT